MRSFLLAIGALALFTAAWPLTARAQTEGEWNSERGAELLAEGKAHFQAEEYDLAVEKFEAAYAAYPDPVALYYAGLSDLKAGRCDVAERKIQNAVNHPTGLGAAADKAKESLATIEECRRASYERKRTLATTLTAEGKYEEALTTLGEVYAATNDVSVRMHMGLVMVASGDCNAARGVAADDSKVEGDAATALLALRNAIDSSCESLDDEKYRELLEAASAFKAAGDLEAARRGFEEAHAFRPSLQTLAEIGLLHLEADHCEDAAAIIATKSLVNAKGNEGESLFLTLEETYTRICSDVDADGLLADADKCPQAAEDFDGFEDADGCPDEDNDQDGVLDAKDQCPLVAEDFDGFEDADGCPDEDHDQDGVLDAKDHCPLVAEDIDGFEDVDGCPDEDNDHDGVLDARDECPLEAEDVDGVNDEDGCPEYNYTWTTILAGTAVACLATGAAVDIIARNDVDEIQAVMDAGADPERFDELHSALASEIWATRVLYGVGVLALAGGVTAFFLEDSVGTETQLGVNWDGDRASISIMHSW